MKLLKPTTMDYLDSVNFTKPSNPGLWKDAFLLVSPKNHGVAAMYNNFEVTDVEFFLRPEVRNYTDAIYRSWGIYKYR